LGGARGGPRGGRGEWLVEKATELGAETLQPLVTHRAAEVTPGKLGRWARVSDAAVKQCLSSYRPQVAAPLDVAGLVARVDSEESALVLVAHPTGARGASEVLEEYRASLGLARGERREGQQTPSVWLVVGPEGDFTEDELNLLRGARGAEVVGLGSRRLRTETAAIALMSLASSAMQDTDGR